MKKSVLKIYVYFCHAINLCFYTLYYTAKIMTSYPLRLRACVRVHKSVISESKVKTSKVKNMKLYLLTLVVYSLWLEGEESNSELTYARRKLGDTLHCS